LHGNAAGNPAFGAIVSGDLNITATTCTNQFIRSLSSAAAGSCASVANADLTNSSTTINGTAIALGASGTVTAAAGTLTGTTLNATVVTSSLTSVGVLASLTAGLTAAGWNGGTTGQTAAINNVNSPLGNGGQLRIMSSTTQGIDLGGSSVYGGYYIAQTNSVDFAEIGGRKESATSGETGGYLSFSTRVNGSNMTEAIRISSTQAITLQATPGASAGDIPLCISTGKVVHSAALTCGTSLEEQKHDLTPLSHGLDWLMQLKPLEFAWNYDGHKEIGFGARSMAQVSPLLGAYQRDGSLSNWDNRAVLAVAVKSIQELETRVRELERSKQ
jgi:hypothetical protein